MMSGLYTQNRKSLRGNRTPDLDLLGDVRGGSGAKNRKTILTEAEWVRILNMPMPARDHLRLAVRYQGGLSIHISECAARII